MSEHLADGDAPQPDSDGADKGPWTPQDDPRLIELYGRGVTLAAIGRDLGRPLWAVHARVEYLRGLGHTLEPRKPRWGATRRSLLAARRRDGATLRQLEREFAITRGTLTYHLRVLKREGLL